MLLMHLAAILNEISLNQRSWLSIVAYIRSIRVESSNHTAANIKGRTTNRLPSDKTGRPYILITMHAGRSHVCGYIYIIVNIHNSNDYSSFHFQKTKLKRI